MGLEGPHRGDLVLRHEAAVTDRIGAQNGGEPANDGVGVHRAARRSSEHQREARATVPRPGGSHASIVPAGPRPGGSARVARLSRGKRLRLQQFLHLPRDGGPGAPAEERTRQRSHSMRSQCNCFIRTLDQRQVTTTTRTTPLEQELRPRTSTSMHALSTAGSRWPHLLGYLHPDVCMQPGQI
jgi:hypothetical protein